MLKPIIYLLRFLNLCHYHFFEVLEKVFPSSLWSQELGQYFKTSPGKIIQAYQQKRPQAAKLWLKQKRRRLSQIFSFYSETDYWVYRQTYFNRHKTFFDIALALLFKPNGKFCEYGGGVGPVTHWLLNKFSGWKFQIIDLDCPVLKFSRWRFRRNPQVSFAVVKSAVPPLKTNFDVIACKQVLEHVPNPLVVVKALVQHLNPGGWLFLDYVNAPGRENLAKSARQRRQVLAYLDRLHPIFRIDPNNPKEGYGLYIR